MTIELRPDIVHEAEEVLHEHDPQVVARRFLESVEASYERFQQELGKGRSGTVWVDHLPLLKHDICMKTLHQPEAAINPLKTEFGLLEKFYQAGVRVPKPYGYIDGGESSRFPSGLYIMEAIHGDTMTDIVTHRANEQRPFEMKELKALLDDLEMQIKLANDQRLYHRDLTLNNMMLNTDSKITLIDFGESTAAFGGDTEKSIYQVPMEKNRSITTGALLRDHSAGARLVERIREAGLLPTAT